MTTLHAERPLRAMLFLTAAQLGFVLLDATGLVAVRTPDTIRCRSLLGAAVEISERDRLLVRATDPAALNAFLVGEGVRVIELGPHRRDLEQLVLQAGARR